MIKVFGISHDSTASDYSAKIILKEKPKVILQWHGEDDQVALAFTRSILYQTIYPIFVQVCVVSEGG